MYFGEVSFWELKLHMKTVLLFIWSQLLRKRLDVISITNKDSKSLILFYDNNAADCVHTPHRMMNFWFFPLCFLIFAVCLSVLFLLVKIKNLALIVLS
jgi:hypothetical protein